VEIHSADGQVRIERHLGFVSIELPPEIASRVVHLKGVGLVSIGFATTLGYADTTLVTLGTECRLLVWIDNAQQIDQLHSVLPDTGNLCVVTESKLKGRKYDWNPFNHSFEYINGQRGLWCGR
jgi:hypothetical protein